jgi:hypothetical protein
MLVGLDDVVERGRLHHALLDQERLECLHAKRDIRRNGLVLVVVGMLRGCLGRGGLTGGEHSCRAECGVAEEAAPVDAIGFVGHRSGLPEVALTIAHLS